VSRYAAIKPHAFDVIENEPLEHPTMVWTHDGILQIGTRAQWQDIPHQGLIRMPHVEAAPVLPIGADHHEHVVEWWRQDKPLYIGVVGNDAVCWAPDGEDHRLVVDTVDNWVPASTELHGTTLRVVLVPAATPGMSLAEFMPLYKPAAEPAEDIEDAP